MQKKKRKKIHYDKNLALISVILGATSFIYSIFTGIPAIIIGIVALRHSNGNRAQAKLGIIFGTIGCLLIIPVTLLIVHFLRPVIDQQNSVPAQDKAAILDIVGGLKAYEAQYGTYPVCQASDTQSSCRSWQSFLSSYQKTIPYDVQFEPDSTQVEDRPAGTLVYAAATNCFLNTPVMPGSSELPQQEQQKYAALIYYHSGGRACFPTGP
jgi:hypothetical protein